MGWPYGQTTKPLYCSSSQTRKYRLFSASRRKPHVSKSTQMTDKTAVAGYKWNILNSIYNITSYFFTIWVCLCKVKYQTYMKIIYLTLSRWPPVTWRLVDWFCKRSGNVWVPTALLLPYEPSTLYHVILLWSKGRKKHKGYCLALYFHGIKSISSSSSPGPSLDHCRI